MAQHDEAKHPRDRQGQWATKPGAGGGGAAPVGAGFGEPEPFTFNKNYGDHEQVRPYMDEFLEVRQSIVDQGRRPCDADFKGRLSSLGAVDDKNENTAIYMLQTLRQRDVEQEREDDFIREGGESVNLSEDFDKHAQDGVMRGTIVRRGWYMGGTGYETHPDSRIVRSENGTFTLLSKGARTHGITPSSRVLFKPKGKK